MNEEEQKRLTQGAKCHHPESDLGEFPVPTVSNPEHPLGSPSSSSVQLWDIQDTPAEGPHVSLTTQSGRQGAEGWEKELLAGEVPAASPPFHPAPCDAQRVT